MGTQQRLRDAGYEKRGGWADIDYAEAMVQQAKDTVKGLGNVL